MPIVDVEIVGQIPADIRSGLAQRLADAAGAALSSRPQRTWVKVRFLAGDSYAENGGGPPDAALPVLVSVLQEKPPGALLAEQALRLATAIAEACGRPTENVHIVFEPAAAGRVAFGGYLQT